MSRSSKNQIAGWLAAVIALSSSCVQAGDLPSGPHPRFLVGNAKAALAANLAAKRPQVSALVDACDAQLGKNIASGYQGFDWTDQLAACAIAWQVTGKSAYAAQAIVYWKALLDDRAQVGDGLGGAGAADGGLFIVCQDAGYSMRTFGVYGALGLDWLHDAPGVDDGLRAHAISRLDEWGDWYEHGSPKCVAAPQGGYLNSLATSNYFAGYLLASWAAAIAVGNDDATVGPKLWARATRLSDTILAPALTADLAGGDQPEGWEYGELTAASWAVASAAAAENGHAPFANGYLHDLIALHLYALHPGNREFLDSGDHQDYPVKPGGASIWGALVAVPNDPFAPFARQYLALTHADGTRWVQAIAEAKSPSWQKADWSHAGFPLSRIARGDGMVLARSGWGPNDGWAAFWASGRLADDHQRCDAGHFEFARGGDDLAIQTAAYATFASWNSNTLMFDDGGANSVYPPLQGPFSHSGKVVVRHFAELGAAVAAQAEFADAYVSNHETNSVLQARREWVYVRPDLVIVSDRDTVAKPSVKVTWTLHTPSPSSTRGATLFAEAGASRLTSQTLLSAAPSVKSVTEPVANAGNAPWHSNETWAKPLYRVEETVADAPSQAFLHALTATAKGTAPPAATVADSGNAHVITVAGDPARIVVLPSASDGSDIALPLSYQVPATGRSTHVLFGLCDCGTYKIDLAASDGACRITVSQGSAGSDPNVVVADRGASFRLADCAFQTPITPDGGGSFTPPDGATSGSPDGSGMMGSSGCKCDAGARRGHVHIAGLLIACLGLLVGRRARRR